MTQREDAEPRRHEAPPLQKIGRNYPWQVNCGVEPVDGGGKRAEVSASEPHAVADAVVGPSGRADDTAAVMRGGSVAATQDPPAGTTGTQADVSVFTTQEERS